MPPLEYALKSTLARLVTLSTLVVVGIFLALAPLTPVRVRAQSREDEEETSQAQLVRSGGQEAGGSMLAVGMLFGTLLLVGMHAYTTQIYPNS